MNDDDPTTVYLLVGGEKSKMGKIDLPEDWTPERLQTLPVMEMMKYSFTEIARVCEQYAKQMREAAETM